MAYLVQSLKVIKVTAIGEVKTHTYTHACCHSEDQNDSTLPCISSLRVQLGQLVSASD